MDVSAKGKDCAFEKSVTEKRKRLQRLEKVEENEAGVDKEANLVNDGEPFEEGIGDETTSKDQEEFEIEERPRKKKKVEEDDNFVTVRLPKDILTPDTLITSKRFQLGNQGATNIVGSILKSAREVDSDQPVDLRKFTFSRASAQRKGVKTLRRTAHDRKSVFKSKLRTLPKTFWLNFDGKDMKQLSSGGRVKEKKHRLAVYLDSPDLQEPPQLLSVATIPSSQGVDQCNQLITDLQDWGASDQICGTSNDTAADITGPKKGAVGRLARFLKRDLLIRACRRHSAERHVMQAAKVVLGKTKSPHWKIFKRMHNKWASFVVDDSHSGINYSKLRLYKWGVNCELDRRATEVLDWCRERLAENTFSRGDYKHLLKLLLVWLGGTENLPGFRFHTAGAYHLARLRMS